MSQTPEFIPGDEFAKVLTETTMSLVCVLDRDGRIRLFNDACERVTGFTRDEVMGSDARDFVIPPEEAEAFSEVLGYVWSTGLSSPQVGHWLTKDGQRKLIAWSNRLMPSEDEGGSALLVTTGIDLSASPTADDDAFEGDPEAKLAEVSRLAQEQRALRRVATLVASEARPERVFAAVSEECARVLEVDASAVFRFEGDDTATIVGRHSRAEGADAFNLGMRLPASEDSGIGQVLRTGAPARIHDYTERPGVVADNMRQMSYRSSVSAPIVVAGIMWGAVGIASAEPLPADTEARLGAFCELVSLAVASAQAREDLSASRARLVKAGDEQRRKLERNLHDGAQQRLVSLALTIRLARRQLESNAETAAASLERAAGELDLALEELRELARGLHPAALTEQGLGPALAGVAKRLAIDVELSAPEDRLPENIEATAYYIVSEALTNVAKHAEATKAKVEMTVAGKALKFEVTDDGRGGADPSAGSGILGLRDRAEAVGGTLFVISPPGKGTIVTAQLPLNDA
ncbi:MAG: GAF domain-containing protein [Actinobacteria bacterium]|nr:MAG: GAF domain-containing protein [Actinomycetota bacterium]